MVWKHVKIKNIFQNMWIDRKETHTYKKAKKLLRWSEYEDLNTAIKTCFRK